MRKFLDGGRIEFRPTTGTDKPAGADAERRRGDAAIRAEILRAIARAPWLDASKVSVAVDHGEVLLEGRVAERRTQTALRGIIGRCRGVRAVHDRLQLAGVPAPP
jgi:osmotically-inducible protein OsmY